jgi:thiamine biosynthesis lipoprotein
MDRRSCLKTTLALGGSLLMPAGVLALSGCSGTARTPELARLDGSIMGTTYSVLLADKVSNEQVKGLAIQTLAEQVYAALRNVDSHMSTWRADSELSRFNALDSTDWQSVSQSTAGVIAEALQTSAHSDGAFDATIAPLVDLWGFGAGADTGSKNTRPSEQAIRGQLGRVGYQAIEVDRDRTAVRKLNAHAQLDLSGIAKGYAVDQVAALLDSRGIENYLVEVGGELRARGVKPDGSAWKVAIERPSVERRQPFRALALEGRAIATSGDYRNFFAEGGQRYSHSIDPRTGLPIDHELASVSVVAESTVRADALSTALIILGPTEAMALAEQHQIAAHLILKSGTSLKEVYSSAFDRLLG